MSPVGAKEVKYIILKYYVSLNKTCDCNLQCEVKQFWKI